MRVTKIKTCRSAESKLKERGLFYIQESKSKRQKKRGRRNEKTNKTREKRER